MVITGCYLQSSDDTICIPLEDQVRYALDGETLTIHPNFEHETFTVNKKGSTKAQLNGYLLSEDGEYSLTNEDCLVVGTTSFRLVYDEKPASKRRKTEDDKKLAPIFNRAPTKKNAECIWETTKQLLVCESGGLEHRSKIAAFDLDGTLIKTKSGKVFPTDENDWQLFSGTVKPKLLDLHSNNHKIVIFTNQSALANNAAGVHLFRVKIENILKQLGVPVQLFAAVKKDKYRKPATGLWELLTREKNGDVEVDVDKSVYVGDAAGRVKGWEKGRKKDFSCSDRLFALNVGLRFLTPEEFFLNGKVAPFEMPSFDPKATFNPNIKHEFPYDLECIVMVGSPGSGKSHFCRSTLIPRGYVHVSRDALKDWKLCVRKLEEELRASHSVVVDNTNPDAASRKRYVDVAKSLGLPCRCFVMATTKDHCRHNNKFREVTDKSHVPVTDIVIQSYWKNFEPPKEAEGFDAVVSVDFQAEFDSAEREKLYRSYLLEK